MLSFLRAVVAASTADRKKDDQGTGARAKKAVDVTSADTPYMREFGASDSEWPGEEEPAAGWESPKRPEVPLDPPANDDELSLSQEQHEMNDEWRPEGSQDPPELYLAHFDVTGVHDG